jgi:hypothetical protein
MAGPGHSPYLELNKPTIDARSKLMRSSLIQISLEVGCAWMLLNLAIVVYIATHFLTQRVWWFWLRRRMLRSAQHAPVVFISPR